MRPEHKASTKAIRAMGLATRTAQRRPHRLTAVKASTMAVAMSLTDAWGRYHCWIASADKMAVSPQVGTQPHQ